MNLRSYISISAILVAGLPALAQDAPKAAGTTPAPPVIKTAPKSSSAPQANMIPRFSFGGRLSYAPLRNMSKGNSSNSVTVGKQTIDTNINAIGTNRNLSGGLTAEIRILPRWSLNIDAMLRRSGWEKSTEVKTVTTTSTSATTTTTITNYESNRFQVMEIPVLLRRYRESRPNKGRMTFYTGGITLRRIQNIKSSQYYTHYSSEDGNTGLECCTENTMWPTKRLVPGATVGAGIRIMDDFRFKITPEFRYTRWLGRNYDPRPSRQNMNQVEVMLSITF